jgi:hypothetical protein
LPFQLIVERLAVSRGSLLGGLSKHFIFAFELDPGVASGAVAIGEACHISPNPACPCESIQAGIKPFADGKT